MPDANGHFRGISVNAAAWERIFGDPKRQRITLYIGGAEVGTVEGDLLKEVWTAEDPYR